MKGLFCVAVSLWLGTVAAAQRAAGNEKVGVLHPPGGPTLVDRFNGKPYFAKYRSLRVPGHKDPLIAEDNGADRIAVDNDGRVYMPTNLGVEIFSPTGEPLGVLPIVWGGETFGLRKPQNVAFAGPDRRTLYIVGPGAVFKVRTLAQGVQGRAK